MKNLNKNIMKNIEKIQEKRKLSVDTKKKIKDRAISNWAICISAIILILAFTVTANLITKQIAILIYNICAMGILVFSLIVLEIAYKKDSGKWAICGIEILILSVFALFSPYIFYRTNKLIVYIFITIVTIYYIAKIIKIYFSEKKKYLTEISDITNIVKKESQDEIAKREQEELLKKMEKKTKKDISSTKKGTAKEKQKNTAKSTSKTTIKNTAKPKTKTQTKSKTTKKTTKTTNKENK